MAAGRHMDARGCVMSLGAGLFLAEAAQPDEDDKGKQPMRVNHDAFSSASGSSDESQSGGSDEEDQSEDADGSDGEQGSAAVTAARRRTARYDCLAYGYKALHRPWSCAYPVASPPAMGQSSRWSFWVPRCTLCRRRALSLAAHVHRRAYHAQRSRSQSDREEVEVVTDYVRAFRGHCNVRVWERVPGKGLGGRGGRGTTIAACGVVCFNGHRSPWCRR
jgi:hypothetical protein